MIEYSDLIAVVIFDLYGVIFRHVYDIFLLFTNEDMS